MLQHREDEHLRRLLVPKMFASYCEPQMPGSDLKGTGPVPTPYRAALRSVPTGFTLIRYETKPAPGNQYGASRGIVTEITSEDEGKAASLMTHGQMGRAQ